MGPYAPRMSEEDLEKIRRWHEAAYRSIRDSLPLRTTYLGLDIDVPEGVFPPARMSELLGRALLAEVTPADRVLDMGTGSGVNAILAASASADVVGVDVNPRAVEAAAANAALNGVSARTRFFASDVFDAVDGSFDLIVFDPPFRWFTPRDLLEAGMADAGYAALTRFLEQASDHLTDRGRVLLFFGTSADIDHLYRLTDELGYRREVLASHQLVRDELTVTYFAFRLRPGSR